MADFVMNTEGEYGGQIVQELSERFFRPSPMSEVYKQWGDRILFIDEGTILEQGTPEEIFNNPKSERVKDFLGKVLY